MLRCGCVVSHELGTTPRASTQARSRRSEPNGTEPPRGRGRLTMTEIYDEPGIRFEYPGDWELEGTDDGPLTTVAVQAPGGLALAPVTVDDPCRAPAEVADQALEALREE